MDAFNIIMIIGAAIIGAAISLLALGVTKASDDHIESHLIEITKQNEMLRERMEAAYRREAERLAEIQELRRRFEWSSPVIELGREK